MGGNRPLFALLGVVAALPAGFILRGRPRVLRWALVLAGFLPFIGMDHITINLIFAPFYRGDARGLELTILDFLLLSVYVGTPAPSRPTPYRLTLALYIFIAFSTGIFADVPMFWAFGFWKLLRMAFALMVIWRACADTKLAPEVLRGMHFGLIYEGILVSMQHWGDHLFQASGNMHHPNSLSMTCNLITPIALALILGDAKSRIAPVALIAGLGSLVFALSRGSLIMFGLAAVLVYFGSLRLGFNQHKKKLIMLGMVAALALGIKALPTLIFRFEHASAASTDSRLRFEQAARYMMADHPLGVGLNLFSEMMEDKHYSERVGIAAHSVDSGAVVHNLYYLTGAELGYAGLFCFLIFLALPLRLVLKGMRKAGDTVLGHALLGCGVALTVVYLQGNLEWLSRQTPFSYVFYMLLAVIAALYTEAQRVEEQARLA